MLLFHKQFLKIVNSTSGLLLYSNSGIFFVIGYVTQGMTSWITNQKWSLRGEYFQPQDQASATLNIPEGAKYKRVTLCGDRKCGTNLDTYFTKNLQ